LFFLVQDEAAFLDSTDNGRNCDFCRWQIFTAQDPGFGRIELQHAVTGSNLFKYAEPSHGVVLFKHHDPLAFNYSQLSDLLTASWLWYQKSYQLQLGVMPGDPTNLSGRASSRSLEVAAAAAGGSYYPFFIWNCLPRAGASQYHGHAQVCRLACAI
jgi:hypothetical protein